MAKASTRPQLYFEDATGWRTWLSENHATAAVAWLVFYKKVHGDPCPSYDEAVREALCFGWIDGVKRSLDADRYAFRFTPRRPGSEWSDSNKRRIAELEPEGRLEEAGRRAWWTWIGDAKMPATRVRRAENAVERVGAGEKRP